MDFPPNKPNNAPFVSDIKSSILTKIILAAGKDPSYATQRDWYTAAAITLRDRIVHQWLRSDQNAQRIGEKRVCYLSLEFLIGRLFVDAVSNLGLLDEFKLALEDFGLDFKAIVEVEPDAALGNGGLGRLAACFMESMSSLGIPAVGYGIRYEHGLFRQIIANGWQEEFPEQWLQSGNPWEFARSDISYPVHFGGAFEAGQWHPDETVLAVAYDTPIVGWRNSHINALRLWSARATDPLDMKAFNAGDHLGAMSEMARAQAISKFLYPSDETNAGRELRLRQEYFFVSASLQDVLSYHFKNYGELTTLPSKVAMQLNDTHPSLAIPELMRLLVDFYGFQWQNAWEIVNETISYTNHTLLPEALETWPLELFQRVLPRHLDIVYRINADHLAVAKRHAPDDEQLLASVSLIDETAGRRIRMGQLAFIGAGKINGVSAMHSQLMRDTVFSDLEKLYPGKITNKTNGISFRRWLHQCNPRLSRLLRETCGDDVLGQPERLTALERLCDDRGFQHAFRAAKQKNKIDLANHIGTTLGTQVDPGAMFDVQIKRIHEYKRQLLNTLETIALYLAIKADPSGSWTPRVKVFSGKAAASYQHAKLIIKFINDVAKTIRDDPEVRNLLQVVFIPNYNVTAAELIVPASDLSEQISTAGMEASGTGNMKLALNGALTVGTLDGANIEIREHVGNDNIFIFGMNASEVVRRRSRGLDATEEISGSPILDEVLAAIDRGMFSPDDRSRFSPITHSIRYLDHYMVAADFDEYYRIQRLIDGRWGRREWERSSILNTARMAWFSSDRTIREYAEEIWQIPSSGPQKSLR